MASHAVPSTTTITAARSSMGVTVAVEPVERTHRRGPSVRIPKARPVTEDEFLGRLYGIGPATAHQRKLVANRLAADVIRFRREHGDTEGAAFYNRPMEIAMAAYPERQGPAELAADRADAQEDELQADYRANPCEGTARALLRKRCVERETSLAHDREIAARWGIIL